MNPSPAPDLNPAETKASTENSHWDWYSKRGHFTGIQSRSGSVERFLFLLATIPPNTAGHQAALLPLQLGARLFARAESDSDRAGRDACSNDLLKAVPNERSA